MIKRKLVFLYRINNGEIEPLIYKTYLVKKDETDKILENATFRRQLWVRMQCESMSMQNVEKLGYYSKELINYFIKYHKCIGEKAISYKRGKFNYNLGLKVGVSQQRFNFSSIQFTDWTIDGVSARFGIENELIFPFNGKKWALLFEPTYQYFSDSATIKKGNTIFSDLYEIDYQSIELQLGIRYYIFLNEKSKFFLNALFVNDINLNGNFMITEGIGNQLKVDLNSFPNYAFGVGYKYKNVASLELKYQTLRNLTYNFVGGNSTYRNISLSACYYFL